MATELEKVRWKYEYDYKYSDYCNKKSVKRIPYKTFVKIKLEKKEKTSRLIELLYIIGGFLVALSLGIFAGVGYFVFTGWLSISMGISFVTGYMILQCYFSTLNNNKGGDKNGNVKGKR